MLQNLGGAHLVAIVFLVVLLFGAPKLPVLAKNLGQSMRIFKREVTTDRAVADGEVEESASTPASTVAAPGGPGAAQAEVAPGSVAQAAPARNDLAQ